MYKLRRRRRRSRSKKKVSFAFGLLIRVRNGFVVVGRGGFCERLAVLVGACLVDRIQPTLIEIDEKDDVVA